MNLISFFSTQDRNRTGTVLLPLVFETNASTSSATWASHRRIGIANMQQVLFPANTLADFFEKIFTINNLLIDNLA